MDTGYIPDTETPNYDKIVRRGSSPRKVARNQASVRCHERELSKKVAGSKSDNRSRRPPGGGGVSSCICLVGVWVFRTAVYLVIAVPIHSRLALLRAGGTSVSKTRLRT